MGLFDFAKKLVDPGGFVFKGDSQKLAEKQYKTEKDIATKNYEEQVRMNDWNIKQQEMAFDYQKDLNAMQMEREDTAIQRRVADLQNAGLSPTLAAGSAASSTPVHAANAPQGVAPQMATPSDVKVQEAMFREGLMKDRMALAMTAMGNFADVARTKAETELTKAKVGEQDIVNKYLDDYLAGRNVGQNYDNEIKSLTRDFQAQTFSDRKDEIKKNVEFIASKIDVNKVEEQLKRNESAYKVYLSAKTQLENKKLGIQIGTEATKAMAEAYTYQWFSSRNLPIGAVSDNALLLALLAAAQQGGAGFTPPTPLGSDGKAAYGNISVRDGHGTTLPSGRKSYGIADILDSVKKGLQYLNSPSAGY